MTSKPPPPPKTKSGTHPAVGAYRHKLDSIVDGEAEELEALNRKLEQYLKDTSPPPAQEEETTLV